MGGFGLFWLLLIAGAAAFPIIMMRKRGQTTWWDYVYPFLGIVLWFALAMVEVGSTASLSNLVVELFWVAIGSIVAPWLRWMLSRSTKRSLRSISFILTFAPMIVALVIRLTMPSLPE